MAEEAKKIVILGGGHGTSVVLASLKKSDFELSAVVSMADNGGSTGRLRRQLGVLPPGDIRQCLVAGSNLPEMQEFFSYRFSDGDLKGHSFGNLFLSAGEAMTGSLEKSIELARKVLDCKAKVMPVTNERVELILTQQSREVKGEDAILDVTLDSSEPRLHLEPAAKLSASAQKAITEADLVIIAPGNFYCSIIPTLLVDGMKEALSETKAKVAYICNLINLKRHTHDFTVTKYMSEIARFTSGSTIDMVIFNTAEIKDEYLRDGEAAVIVDINQLHDQPYKRIGVDIAGKEKARSNPNDAIANTRSLLAHDKAKLAEVITQIAGRL